MATKPEEKPQRTGIEISIAIAEAVRQCDVDCIAAYPITPQTHIVEHISELVADGELDAEFIPVESEHSAMSVCSGTSAAGARTFTATASQGLALMSEIVFVVSSLRQPIVMVLANRSLNSPLSIWNDHSDVMYVRDCGWIQVFVENGQETYDHIFWAFRVAEDHKVLIPVMINMDGFILSHTIEPIEMWTEDMVKKYLPPYEPLYRLHPDKPITMGAFGPPEIFTETKMAQNQALLDSYPLLLQGWKEIKDVTGREYKPVETYKTEGARELFVSMGSIGETAREAIDSMREVGEEVGLISLRLWRPFPFEEFKNAIAGAEMLMVLDRAVSFGGPGGPVASELRSALYHQKKQPRVLNIVVGLAGRDVQPDDFWQMLELCRRKLNQGTEDEYVIYGVRE
jgi:pyruvate ferredoxin oxidoreductase alpha subunit